MVATLAFVVAALALGVIVGWLVTRSHGTPSALPDPVVLQTYAAKRAALEKEAPHADPLSLADAAAALRRMAK